MYNSYVYEKLSELEREGTARRVWQPRPGRRSVLAPVTRAAGGALRRLGERLETRAASPERDRGLVWVRVR